MVVIQNLKNNSWARLPNVEMALCVYGGLLVCIKWGDGDS